MFGGWFSSFGGGIPNFPFTVGDAVGEVQPLSGVCWTIRQGTATEGNAPVTIFTLIVGGDASASSTAEQCGRNALKRAKTLKLPGFLKVLDATEHKDTVYIATEPCVPLATALTNRTEYYEDDDDKFAEGVALGLHSVAKALESLHRNNLAHHNVNGDAVFVLPSGEWRLFGVDLVSNFDEEHSLYRRCRTCIAEHRVPGGRGADTVSSVDAWGLGCLIYETFRPKSLSTITTSDLRVPPPGMPRKLQPTLSGLFASEPKLRWTMSKFLTECALLTESDYVSDLHILSELSIRDPTERESFLRTLSSHVDHYPLPACKLLILPKLNNAVQFGACTATVLEPLLRLGARLNATDFAQHVSPSVVALFASQDQLVRHRLLTTAEEYASLLPAQLVCDTIWPQYALGFSHKSPEIRELSVRALVHFGPHLNERIMTGDVVKYVSQLQTDREGPIRTNSTICLGLIAKYLPASERSKILLNGFGRMLKDPFGPSRVAATRSIATCLEHFTEDQMAKQILPALAPMTLDPEEDVRKTTFKCIKSMMHKIEAFASTIAAPPLAATEQASVAPAATTSTPTAQPATPTVEPATAAPASKSWFGGWSRSAATTASPASSAAPAPAEEARLTPPRSTASDDGVTASVPTVPTARSAKTLHEDPADESSSSASPHNSWLDEMGSSSGATPSKPIPLAQNSAARGMTLRKKGLGGVAVKKAE